MKEKLFNIRQATVILVVIGFLFILLPSISAASWDNSLDTNMIFYYNGNTTSSALVTGLSYLNLTGTATNGTAAGKVGKAFAVGGASDLANITYPFNLNSMTMNWWVKSSQGETQYMQVLGGASTYCYFHEGGVRGHYCVIGGQSAINTNTVDTLGSFEMITLTQNATSQALYVNGVIVASAVQTGTVTGNSIGTKALSGNIDEWSLWSRSLSSSEISQLYNSGSGLTYSAAVTGNATAFNASTYETRSETFLLNQSYLGYMDTVTANFNYAGSSYPSTVTRTGNNITLSNTIDIPVGVGTNIFNWTISISNSTYSDTYTTNLTNVQTVVSPYFILCNSTINIPYLNYTFKDEQNNSNVNGSITSSFIYYLGSGTVTKAYSYQNTNEYYAYAFCGSPNVSTFYVKPSLQYYNSQSATRTYNYDTFQTLTNSSTNKVLYLLKTSSGIYSSFQIVNPALQPISNALVTVSLNNNTIETKLTDGSGLSTFLLNPNSQYTLTVSASGYSTFSTLIYPTQTSYTITLSSVGSGNITSYMNGITYTTLPAVQFLNNDTTYAFNVTLSSSYLLLDSWGFNVSDNISSLGSASDGSGYGGSLSKNILIRNNTVNVSIYWIVNGTTTVATRTYNVQNMAGNEWSIYYLVSDFKTYLGTGIFGMNSFAINILIFFIIFLTTGVLSYKFGLYSPTAIAGIIFALTFVFDFVLGLITYTPSVTFPAATLFTFIILLGLIIKEGTGY